MSIFFQEILSTFLQWQGKIDNLFDSSKKVVPVHLRTKPLDHYRPVTTLCNYKTKEVSYSGYFLKIQNFSAYDKDNHTGKLSFA